MTKIYVVTSGQYSDYHIIGVASTKERADQLAKTVDGYMRMESQVEEYELDEYADYVACGLKNYMVHISLADSNNCRVFVHEPEKYDLEARKDCVSEGGLELAFTAWARDEQHARKIASEKRAEWIATHPK